MTTTVDQKGTLSFTVKASFDLRGGVRRAIRRYCWTAGFDLHVEEDRGWFTSVTLFRITLPASDMPAAQAEIQAWIDRVSR